MKKKSTPAPKATKRPRQTKIPAPADMTGRQRAEDVLREREAELRLITNNIPGPISRVDRNLRYLFVNDQYEKIFGKPRAAIVGHRMPEVMSVELFRHVEPYVQRVLAGEPITFESKTRMASGDIRPFLVSFVPDFDPEMKVVGFFVIGLDITERKQAEEALARERNLLREIFDILPDYIYLKDAQSRFIMCNNRRADNDALQSTEELIGKTDADFFPPEQAAQFRADELVVLGGTPLIEKEETLIRPDGNQQIILTTKLPFRDSSGKIVGLLGYGRDITERKQKEQRIQQLNRVYAVLSDVNQTIVREKDPQAILEAVCRIAVDKGKFRMAWVGIFNPVTQVLQPVASSGVVEGYTDLVRVDLRDQTHATGPAARCILSGEHAICNDIAHDPFYLPWRDGALRRGYQSSGGFPLKVGDQIVGVFSLYAGTAGFFDADELCLLDELAMDISFALEVSQREMERRNTEDELRWKTAFFEAQVDSSPDGILVVDNQGKKILQNQRLNELWKIPPQITGDMDDAAQIQFVINQTKNPQQFTDEITRLYSNPDAISRDVIELKDGTILDRFSSPVRDNAGKYYGRIWAFRDITERRRLEEQFRQSQKMEAIGQLAGGVAHDFNNILAAIMMQADLTAMCENLPEEVRDGLREIRISSERAVNLTRQLLAFSRRQVMKPRQLDLNEIVTSLTKMLQRILGEDVRLQLNLHPGALLTRADPGMLDQALLNLVINARDAMPNGGQLFIETGEKVFTEEETRAIPDVLPGRHVYLRVRDTGSGIAPENLPRIFEPFFTTKEPGKGTGLGLATVFGIVKQHSGSLAVESEVGQGTMFQIFLPATEAAVESPAEAPVKPKPRGGTETILLVEDEPSVRMLTRAVLERAGYRVLEAPDGIKALRIWEQNQDLIRLLLTDIVMPEGVSGLELAASLQTRNPKLQVIFTSGYSAEIAGRELSLQEGQNFIQKPCAPQQILEIVRQCLDR